MKTFPKFKVPNIMKRIRISYILLKAILFTLSKLGLMSLVFNLVTRENPTAPHVFPLP